MQDWQEFLVGLRGRRIENGAQMALARGEMYQKLVKECLRQKGVIRVNVRVVDERAGVLWFAAWGGPGWEADKRSYRYGMNSPCLGKGVAESRKARYFPRVRQEPSYVRLFDDDQSEFIVPVILRNRVETLLTVDSIEEDGLDEETRQRIQQIADQASQALEHFAILQEKWIFDLLSDLAKTTSLGEVCQKTVDSLARIFGVRSVSLFLYDDQTKIIRRVAQTIQDTGELVFEVGQGLTGWVAATRKTLRLRNYRDPEELRRIDPKLEWKNKAGMHHSTSASEPHPYLGAAISSDQHLLGVVSLTQLEFPSEFAYEEQNFLETIVEQVALKIGNIQLITKQEIQLIGSENIQRLGRKLAGTQALQEAGGILVEELPISTHCFLALVRVGDQSRSRLSILATTHDEVNDVGDRLVGDPLIGKAAEQKNPLFISDIRTRPEWEAVLNDHQHEILRKCVAAAFVPLLAKGQLVGSFSLFWVVQREFTVHERNLINELAQLAALSLEACLLYEATQERLSLSVDVMRDLREVGIGFAKTLDIQKLCERVLESAINLARLSFGTIRKVSDDGKWLEGVTAYKINADMVRRERLSVDDLPQFREAFKQGTAVVMPSTHEEPAYRVLIERLPEGEYRSMVMRMKAMILVPIQFQGRPLALILLDSGESIKVSETLIQYLEILAGYAAIAWDNAKLHAQREESLKLAEPLALMGELLGGFQHRFKNPLQALQNRVTLLMHPESNHDNIRSHLTALQHSVNHLDALSRELRNLAQANTSSLDAKVDLYDISHQVLREKLDSLKERGVSAQFPEVPAMIEGNVTMLRIALEMLLDNAVEAMEKSEVKRVSIVTHEDKDVCSLIVSDTGEGMDEETKQKCTEVFYTNRPTGTGLGLAIVNGVVRRHRGGMVIDSESGKGTSVTLEFPRFREVN